MEGYCFINFEQVCVHLILFQQANAIGGRNEKAVQEFLEKNWTTGLSDEETVRLAVKALLEVVDSGSKNMEVAVLKFGLPVKMLPEDELQNIISDIERELDEAKKGTQEITPMES